MAQNVGPILEMVTEKYLLRSEAEWQGRQEALGILEQILDALREGDIARVGAVTTRNFQGPLQTIIPWASTYYTERLIEQVRAEFGADFWGFWMLGGMCGGGMGFIFAPARKAEAQERLQAIMSATKRELQHALPFAMEPVVYDFAINEHGTFADLLAGRGCADAAGYYALTVPELAPPGPRARSRRCAGRSWINSAPPAAPDRSCAAWSRRCSTRLFPRGKGDAAAGETLAALLEANGFDAKQHEQIRARPARGPHRARAEPPAGQRRDRGRAARRTWSTRRSGERTATAALASAGWQALRRGRGRRRLARRRRGHALDARRGRGEGAAPVRQARRPAPHLPRDASREVPPHRAARRHAAAAHLHHQLPHARADRRIPRRARRLRLRRAAAPLAAAKASACAWSRRSATCASPGRKCRSRCSTSSSRKCATACAPR